MTKASKVPPLAVNRLENSSSDDLPIELVNAPRWAQEIYHILPPLVSYAEIGRVTHRTKETIANMCCKGNGPKGGKNLGRKKVFPHLSVVLWLLEWMAASSKK